MDSGGNSVNSAGESVAESPAPASPASNPTAAVTKGRGLRRWRRIPREHHEEGSPGSGCGVAAAAAAAAADEDLAQLHKRRLPLGADAPKGKEEAAAAAAAATAAAVEVESESPVASVESSFAPPEAPPSPPVQTKLDPDLGFLIASAGFSVGAGGADSDNSDDRASKSSTNAAAPRHDFSFGGGFGRERDRPRSRAPGAAAHGKGIRMARTRGAHGARAAAAAATASVVEPENSRSSVESNLRSSGAAHARQSSAGISSNGVHKVLYDDDDDDDDAEQSDGEPPSEEARSGGGFYRENGSVVGRLVKGSSDSDADDHGYDEGSIGKGENGEIHSGLDPYVQSIALLRSAEEAIENEIQKFIEMRNETCENSANNNSETEWSSSFHFDESAEELSEKLKLLESRLEEASTLINDKDSRILDALNHKQPKQHVLCNTELLSLQSDMDQLFLEKMEAETQCFILTRASQAWNPLSEDQAAIFDIQKSLPEDHKQLEAKLRHTENRAMMLEEMVEKLEAQCKDLARTSEILKLQARASRASLFCSVQFVLLFIAVGTFLVRLWPSSSEFVPT